MSKKLTFLLLFTCTLAWSQNPLQVPLNYSVNIFNDSIVKLYPNLLNYKLRPGHSIISRGDTFLRIALNMGARGVPYTEWKEGSHYTVEYRWIYPSFPGGMDSLNKFIYRNLRISKEAIKAQSNGLLDVFFRIDKTGAIQRINVGDGDVFGRGEEAKRLFTSMPKWKPGSEDGKPAEFSLRWTIKFCVIDGKPMTYEQFYERELLEKNAFFYNLALELLKDNFYKTAIPLFTEAIGYNAKDADSYYGRGVCWGQLANREKLCADLKKALELGGKDHRNLGRLCK